VELDHVELHLDSSKYQDIQPLQAVLDLMLLSLEDLFQLQLMEIISVATRVGFLIVVVTTCHSLLC
jgi:hypothetical protein